MLSGPGGWDSLKVLSGPGGWDSLKVLSGPGVWDSPKMFLVLVGGTVLRCFWSWWVGQSCTRCPAVMARAFVSGSCCCPGGWLGQSCRRRPAVMAIIGLESVGRVESRFGLAVRR